MENTLRIRYDKEINKLADVVVKHSIAKGVGMTEEDLFVELEQFKDDDKGNYIAFVYDDEIGGETIMTFGEDSKSAYVEISSDYVCNVIAVNEIIQAALNFVEA